MTLCHIRPFYLFFQFICKRFNYYGLVKMRDRVRREYYLFGRLHSKYKNIYSMTHCDGLIIEHVV